MLHYRHQTYYLLSAVDMVSSLRTIITENTNFTTQFKETVSMCCKYGIKISQVKRRKVSNKIDSTENQYFPLTIEEELKNTIYLLILDNLILGIENCYDQKV